MCNEVASQLCCTAAVVLMMFSRSNSGAGDNLKLHWQMPCTNLTHGLVHQVQVGHVRLMLPCGESQSAVSQEEAGLPSGAGSSSMERSNSAFASVDMDMGQQAPNMLVIILAGFQATSRTTEARVSSYASGVPCWLPCFRIIVEWQQQMHTGKS